MVKKTASKKKLLQNLDKVFSNFIRMKYANKDGIAACYTCGKEAHWSQLYCGHFQSRKHRNTRFDVDNCRVQCARCNIFDHGQQFRFGIHLEEERQGLAFDVERRARIRRSMSVQEYIHLARYYDKACKVEQLRIRSSHE
jgi:hypothetical protein